MSYKILITGASGGFGKLISLSLLNAGHQVVATMRNPTSKNQTAANQLTAAGAKVVGLDVTRDNSVNAAVGEAGPLDIVINNAGTGVLGIQECFTPEDWRQIFEINVFGVQRLNRAVLPAMRAQGSGLLIHISSLIGRMALPFFGPYVASKWALEALAENYRAELSRFGIQSCIVEPGGYPTPFMDALMKPGDTERTASFGDFAHVPQTTFENFEKALAANPAQDPHDVADAVVNLIHTPAAERPFRTIVDRMGMGDHIQGYNDQLEQITAGIYQAFGMGDMLKLKT